MKFNLKDIEIDSIQYFSYKVLSDKGYENIDIDKIVITDYDNNDGIVEINTIEELENVGNRFDIYVEYKIGERYMNILTVNFKGDEIELKVTSEIGSTYEIKNGCIDYIGKINSVSFNKMTLLDKIIEKL